MNAMHMEMCPPEAMAGMDAPMMAHVPADASAGMTEAHLGFISDGVTPVNADGSPMIQSAEMDGDGQLASGWGDGADTGSGLDGLAPIGDMARCEHAGGGVYPTTRKPREGEMEWPDVGVNAVSALAKWVSELPSDADCVVAFQLANEPALGPSSTEVYAAILAFYERARSEARKYLPTVPLIFSFMGPTPATQNYLREADAADKLAGGDGFLGRRCCTFG